MDARPEATVRNAVVEGVLLWDGSYSHIGVMLQLDITTHVPRAVQTIESIYVFLNCLVATACVSQETLNAATKHLPSRRVLKVMAADSHRAHMYDKTAVA